MNMGSDCIWRSSDTDAELELVCGQARQAGAFEAVQCTNWSDGGAGALALAEAVQRAAKLPGQFRFLYDTQVRSGIVGKLCTSNLKNVGLNPTFTTETDAKCTVLCFV